MSRRIVKRTTALHDLIEIATHISNDGVEAAERFLDAAEATIQGLQTVLVGTVFHLPRAGRVRVCTVRGFMNYLVVYRDHDDAVEILRLIHGARDWQSLLSDEPSGGNTG